MLHNTKEFYGHTLTAADGHIGHVHDLYFDDQTWAVRYLVADTGGWLTGRQVLLAPPALGKFSADGKVLPVHLTRKQIEQSPSIESHRPVSRQYEEEYYRYYGWPAYWDGSALGGFPIVTPTPEKLRQHANPARRDHHLRSTKDLTGYAIQATDGPIGSVRGFLVDDQTWTIRDLVVETGHWFSGKEIKITTRRIERISYEDSKVFVHLTKADLEHTAEDATAQAGTATP